MSNILKEIEKYEKSNVRQYRNNTKFHSPVIYDSTCIIPLLNVIDKMQTIYSFKQDDSTFTIITIRPWHYQYLHVVQITFTETC